MYDTYNKYIIHAMHYKSQSKGVMTGKIGLLEHASLLFTAYVAKE